MAIENNFSHLPLSLVGLVEENCKDILVDLASFERLRFRGTSRQVSILASTFEVLSTLRPQSPLTVNLLLNAARNSAMLSLHPVATKSSP